MAKQPSKKGAAKKAAPTSESTVIKRRNMKVTFGKNAKIGSKSQ